MIIDKSGSYMWMFTSKNLNKINLSTGGRTVYYYYGGYNFIMDSNEENIYFTPYYLNNSTLDRHRIYKFNISTATFSLIAGDGNQTAGVTYGIGSAASFSYPKNLFLNDDNTILYFHSNGAVIIQVNIVLLIYLLMK